MTKQAQIHTLISSMLKTYRDVYMLGREDDRMGFSHDKDARGGP
jgi:hypothetical protein